MTWRAAAVTASVVYFRLAVWQQVHVCRKRVSRHWCHNEKAVRGWLDVVVRRIFHRRVAVDCSWCLTRLQASLHILKYCNSTLMLGISQCAELCSTLTLAAVSVSCKLITRVAGTSVAAQCVHTALLAVTVVGCRALVHLWQIKNQGISLLCWIKASSATGANKNTFSLQATEVTNL